MDRNNKTCSELIKDKLNERIVDFKQTLRSHKENNDEIDRIIYYSLEIMEKILGADEED